MFLVNHIIEILKTNQKKITIQFLSEIKKESRDHFKYFL